MRSTHLIVVLLSVLLMANCGPKFKEEVKTDYNLISHPDGPSLGYNSASGVSILTIEAFEGRNAGKD